MANLITVRLNKGDSPSWGFRLQGGKDFGAPLVIQKVNVGSPAERAGLIAGDSVIRVNNTDVFNLRHKDAQDVIVRAGPSFDVTIQRGGSTWKPAVIPTGSLSSPKPHVPASNIAPVTKTSLAAPTSDNWGSVGTGHNVSAKPFSGGAVNGTGPKLVNKQYNSPVNLYSEDTIAETLSAQAEVLANGVLGVNFKKNEKTYDASKSNVLRYVQEDELDPKSPEPAHDSLDGGVVTTPSPLGIAGLRPVKAPENKPAPSNPTLPPGQNICAECERLIVGVFVRIKEKNLHVECFKCSTCGTSLKNVGYYNINNKLYCDVHAKLAARSNPPNSNLAPVTIPPFGRPGGGVSSLSPNSLPSSAPLSPNINSYAPPPFQTHDPYSGYVCVRSNAPGLIKASLNSAASRIRTVTNDVSNPVKTNPFSPTTTTYIPNYAKTNIRSGPNIGGPRPFSSGPLSPSGNNYSTLPKVTSTPLSSDRNTSLNVVWPPPPPEESEVPTACPIYLPPPSHVKVKTIENSCAKQISKEYSTEKCKVEKTQTQEQTTTQEVAALNAANLSKLSACFEQDIMSYVTSDIGQYSSHYSDTSSISGRKSTQECVEILNEVIDNQRLVEKLRRTRPLFVETDDSILSQEQPMWEAKSVLKEGSCVPIVNIQSEQVNSHLSAKSEMATSEIQTSTKEEKKEIASTTSRESPSTCSIKLNRYTKKVENAVPHEYESPMVLALTVASDRPFSQMQVEITKSEHTRLDDVAQEVTTTEQITSSSSAQHSTQLQQVTSSQIEQKIEQTAQHQSLQMEEEKSISQSTFEAIPEKISSSAFASALVTAPAEPFGICQTPTEPVALPEETKPYFPPSDLFAVKISSKSEEEIKKSEKLSRFRKKKDELDDIFKDLPKPTQKLDLLSALTTASDRPFSPLPAKLEEEASEVSESAENLETDITQQQEVNAVDKSAELLKPSAPKGFKATEPRGHESLTSVTEETRVATGKNVESVSTRKHTTQAAAECKSKAVECKSKTVKCKSQVCSKSKKDESREAESTKRSLSKKQEECSGVESIYFKDQKIDYSTKVENDEKRAQPIKEGPLKIIVQDDSTKSAVATEKDKISKCSKIPKPNPEIKGSEYKEVRMSSETQFSATSGSQVHEERHVSRISSHATSQIPTKVPITAINHGEYQQRSIPGTTFQPVLDEKAPNKSFSPRPRSITPSMINKAPPLIPAYQAMLVPMECLPPLTNVFDPTSQESSRAPSPCPGRVSASSGRASPFPSKTSARSISPAQGPPRNPLEIINPKPQPSPRVVEAKSNIATVYQKSNEDRVKQVKAAKYALEKVSSDVAASQSTYQTKTGDRVMSQTCTAQRGREQQLQEQMQAQSESVEVTQDKNMQVQRKKKVVEEYEHSQKSKTVEIAKSTLTTKSRLIGGDCQVAVSGMHVTNPQPLRNPFQQKSITEVPKKPVNGVEEVSREEIKIDTSSNNGTKESCQNKSCTFATSNIPKLVKTKSFPTSGSSPKPFIPPPPCDDVTKPFVSQSNAGSGSGRQVGAIGFSPKRGRGVLNIGGGSRVPLCGHCHKNIRSDINPQTNQNNKFEREGSFERNNDEIEDKLKEFSEITITIPHHKSSEPFLLESTSPGSNCSSLSSGNIHYYKQTASESSDSGKPESLHDGDLHYGPRISSSEDLHSSMELSIGYGNPVSETDNCSTTSLIMLDHAYPNNDEKACLSQLSSTLKEKAKTYREMTASSEKQNFKHFANAEESNSLYPEEVLTSVPICNQCNKKITRGPFVTALGKIWCPEHFSCATPSCKRPLQDLGFVEEQGQLYCEYCFERYLAPNCSKCGAKVKAECLKAIGKHFHPECFNCVHCGKLFGNNPFFLEDGQPYCDNDWNELFTTKCFACGFPIEAGDRWVEALNNNYHSQCFNCTMCKKNLEGQSFFAKGGRPFCKNHAR